MRNCRRDKARGFENLMVASRDRIEVEVYVDLDREEAGEQFGLQ